VWSIYGVLKDDMTVLVPNFTGTISGLICATTFHIYAKDVARHYYYICAAVILVALGLSSFQNAPAVGSLGVTLAVIMMGSPLSTLQTVIRDKNTNALPFGLSFTTFLNAMSWSSYGILIANDPMIYVPNIIGLTLATIQLSLFGIYGMPKETGAKQAVVLR
jgi:solute carrier family 50 protein (sugar transporter)